MRINHNLASLNTYRQLSANSANGSKSLEKLSSGLRINKAGDDAAGLAISEKMRGQIRGLDQASSNAQNGISLLQTAEGGLNETHSILQRMRELAVQSATDTNTSDDRSKIQSEVDQLAKEITRISNTTEFNTQNLMAGGLSHTYQIGANKGQNISLSINAMDAQSLGVAGSSVAASSFTAANGLQGVQDAGRGLASGTDYTIDAVKTAAAAGVALARAGGTGTEVDAASSVTYAGFTGTSNTAYTVKVASVSAAADANDVNSVMYSKDAGSTWTTATSVVAAANSASTFDGLVFNLATADAAQRYAVGDTFTFTANASSATLQLQKGGVGIGAAATVAYGSTNAIVGDASLSKTLRVNYDFPTATSATSGVFTVASSASTTATVVGGVVTVDADTKAGIDVSGQTSANLAISTIDDAIKTVSTERSKLGSFQNRLEHTIANLGTSSENLTAAESRIRDVDMAKEMMEFTKNNILSQAAQAMLAQANQQPQGVLQLLR